MSANAEILSQRPVKSHLKISQNIEQESEDTMYFQLKQLDGDRQIYLGRSILALMTINKSPSYTKQQNKSFDIDLLASLIIELGISKDEICEAIQEKCV